MRINVNKSVCRRFGQRFSIQCANLITHDDDEVFVLGPLHDEMMEDL